MQNIPIELLRSFVVIQESGSFTKAAESLNLTQPAISAQIKRLQQLVSGELFVRSGFGVSLSDKGEIVSRYARRILAMSDQLLSLTGASMAGKPLRIGIPSVFAPSLLADVIGGCRSASDGERLHFTCDGDPELLRNLSSGFLDIALVMSTEVPNAIRSAQWPEAMCWVCKPGFRVDPGMPIPLQSWLCGVWDRSAIGALERARLSYSIVFASADLSAHLAAARAGIGYAVIPQRLVSPDLKVARERFLPPLPPCEMGIYVDRDKESRTVLDVAARLATVLRPSSHTQIGSIDPEPSWAAGGLG
jgi:DNA-binding transcriptional LysR family regulator